MIDLARKLSDCDEEYFGGWVLAGVEIKLQGEATHLENSVLLAKGRRCDHEARGYNHKGELVQSLRLFLVLPKNIGSAVATNSLVGEESVAQKISGELAGELVYRHSFIPEEIHEYAAYTGDENVIHKGEHPLVPGICMLYALQRHLQLQELSWRASFLAPVYTGDELLVYRTEKGYTAYVGTNKAFVVKI